MNVVQVDPTDRKQVNEFIELPFRVYKDYPLWVPPLEMEARSVMNPGKHRFYKHGEAAFFLAMQEDHALGRIVAINNHRFNELNQTKAAFFYWFECLNDPAVAKALFDSVFEWARQRGLNRVIGPKGFTPLDGAGILVEGFEHRPAFGMPYNPAYYLDMIQSAGFQMHRETVSGYLRRETAVFPERIHELAERVATRRGLRIVNFRTRKELRSLVPHLTVLYNASLSGVRENDPLSEEDMGGIADMLLMFADPELIKLVMKDNEVVGFLVAYPDVSPAIQKCKGRLFPLGWFHILREAKRTHWINLNGIGLLEEYRGLGGSAILASEIAKTLIGNLRYTVGDFVQIGLDNDKMQREIANFGVDFCKKHRVFSRDL